MLGWLEAAFFGSSGGRPISGLALLVIASPLTLLEQTSGVARVILGILFVLSIFSWALIFQKWAQLGGIDNHRPDVASLVDLELDGGREGRGESEEAGEPFRCGWVAG